jgi:diguanylate cyclase (GGDEF)-like protein
MTQRQKLPNVAPPAGQGPARSDGLTGQDMVLSTGLGSEAASVFSVRVSGAMGALLIGIFLGVSAHASRPWDILPGFIPAFLAIIVVADLITAALLLMHASLARRYDLLWLGGAYLFSGSVATGQALVFPGIASAAGLFHAGPQSAIWLWVFWHGGFPCLIGIAMAMRWRREHDSAGRAPRPHDGLLVAAFILGIVIGLEILVTRFQALLPVLLIGHSYGNLALTATGGTVLLLNLGALAAVILVTRGRSVIDLVLTLMAGARYSMGWYIGRAFSITCALPVLTIYLRELTWLHARVMRLNQRLAEQAHVDATTALFNRRYFNHVLADSLDQAADHRRRLGLLLIDVDHFKRYNDSLGHLAGDDCLYRVAQAVQGALDGPGEIAARFGGEEFAVILPSADPALAASRAEAILNAVRGLGLHHPDSPTASYVTVSIGIALAGSRTTIRTLIAAADASLYAAKSAGRNQVGAA